MKRRLQTAIMAIAVSVILLFGLPLALAAQRFYHAEAVVNLQRDAIGAGTEVALPLTRASLTTEFGRSSPRKPSVYDASGRLVYGPGPGVADAVVGRALRGRSADAVVGDQIVVAAPVSDSVERVIAAVRVTRSTDAVTSPIRRVWITMALLALILLVSAWFVARWQARRLGRPIDALASTAVRLGKGDFTARAGRSGIPELDELGEAFDETAARLGELVERERSFSADASHQLRTPLAALKLRLEMAARRTPVPGSDALDAVIGDSVLDVERLTSTIEHLLARTRGVPPTRAELDVDQLVADLVRRWAPLLGAAGRGLAVDVGERLPVVRVSPPAVREILDALIDNATVHGAGIVTIRVRATPGGLALDVLDEGDGVADAARATIFERHQGRGTGIGLALARSLAESEGARLTLRVARPPCFTLLLAEAPPSRSFDGIAPLGVTRDDRPR